MHPKYYQLMALTRVHTHTHACTHTHRVLRCKESSVFRTCIKLGKKSKWNFWLIFPLWDVKMLISFSPFLCVALSQNIYEELLGKDWAEESERNFHLPQIETCFHCGEVLNILILVTHLQNFYRGVLSCKAKATYLLWLSAADSKAHTGDHFQAPAQPPPTVSNNGLTGVGVSPKITHAQGSPKLQGKLEMFYGLE